MEEQYGSCEAVLSVSSTHENKRNGKTEYQIRGRILYGKASKGDMIQVAQNGSSNLMRIKWLQQPNGEAADSVGEGYYAIGDCRGKHFLYSSGRYPDHCVRAALFLSGSMTARRRKDILSSLRLPIRICP